MIDIAHSIFHISSDDRSTDSAANLICPGATKFSRKLGELEEIKRPKKGSFLTVGCFLSRLPYDFAIDSLSPSLPVSLRTFHSLWIEKEQLRQRLNDRIPWLPSSHVFARSLVALDKLVQLESLKEN